MTDISSSSSSDGDIYTVLATSSAETVNPFSISSLPSNSSSSYPSPSSSSSASSFSSFSSSPWYTRKPSSSSSSSSPAILSYASSTAIPLVPTILNGMDFPEHKDPLAFTEICPVRGVGAAVMGGLFGFFLGGFFSGYGQLAPYDPALKDWQQTNLAKANATVNNASPTVASASSSSSSTVPSSSVPSTTPSSSSARIQPYSPVHLPELQIQSPLTKLNPLGSSLASSARSILPSSLQPTTTLVANTTSSVLSISPNALSTVNLPGSLPYPTDPANVPLRIAFVQGLKEMGTRAVSSGKNFALVGAVYSTIECFLEKARGKRDLPNALISGFSTGAILAARAGPSAMVMGGAGFAAFSGAIEILSPYIFDH